MICLVRLKSVRFMSLSGSREKGSGGRRQRKTPWFLSREGRHLILFFQQGCTQSRRVNCLKGHQRTLRKGTWMLGTTNGKCPLNSSPLPLLPYCSILGLPLLLPQPKPPGVVLTLGIEGAKDWGDRREKCKAAQVGGRAGFTLLFLLPVFTQKAFPIPKVLKVIVMNICKSIYKWKPDKSIWLF